MKRTIGGVKMGKFPGRQTREREREREKSYIITYHHLDIVGRFAVNY